MSPNIIKVNYPKDFFDDVNAENLYEEELAKLTSESFANASTTNTLKHIKACLAKRLRKQYNIKDKDELTKKVNDMLDIHGLTDDRFDPMNIFSRFMSNQVNDVSIDDNGNKDSNKAIRSIIKESELAFDKLLGYDYLYRTMKELYGKDEAQRIMGEMFDYSLALGDSTKIMVPYCWALDASKLVMEGRPFGMLKSRPAKSVDSYTDCLCDSVPELSNHLAGAIAIGTLFLDIAHLLIYKQRISLKTLKEDKVFRKYLENRFQKIIHSVNHPSRGDGTESPFTNVSVFDKEKLHGFIGPDNYQWYFPKNIKVLADNELGGENGKISREEFDNFIVDYIFEVQKIFIDFFDKGDPEQNGMQYRFPVATVNMSKHKSANGQNFELDKDNEMLNYIIKKDIARYNIFCSEGSKICSCCRMINDKEMMDSLGSAVNSFGGSGGASLGSHRVVTINFVRIAYEADSYDEFKKILKERVEDAAKVLKAHKVLILKLQEMGLQPFMDRGWISAERFFSTFGVNGIYEADIICKDKFGQLVDDYRADILTVFNEYYRAASKKESIAGNAEQIPAESMAPKLFKSDNMLFGNPYNFPNMYANQFVPTWEKTTIKEKFTIEGKYDSYLNGGSVCHIQIGSDITPSQAKQIIMESVAAGCEHFALNAVYSRCKDCGEVQKARWEECPHCHSENVEHLSRVVGFFVVMESVNKTRRENDWMKRKFINKDELEEQMKK